MTIHREGRLFLSIYTAFISIFGLLLYFLLPALFPWFFLPGMVFFVLFLQFFRHPTRNLAQPDDKLVYAPCDGKVVVIEEAYETEVQQDRRLQVSIFMSPLNVHVNRYPVGGTVEYYKYHPGKFLVAWHPKSSTDNERTTTVLRTAQGHAVLMRQVAGAVARRIIAYVHQGAKVRQGDELGFIKFGSRVDLYLPLNSEILVSLDQVVKGNTTLIAKLP